MDAVKLSISDVNKDWTPKDKDLTLKDKDKDKDHQFKFIQHCLLQILQDACHRSPLTVKSLYPNFNTRGVFSPGPVTVINELSEPFSISFSSLSELEPVSSKASIINQ